MSAFVKSPADIALLKKSGKILAKVLAKLKTRVGIGIDLLTLEELAKSLIKEAGASPAFLGYRPEGARFAYPYAICASLNEAAVHGKPFSYRLKSGDILKLDLGVDFKGMITDTAVTIGVGEISREAKRLLRATEKALSEGIKAAKPGRTVGDIGYAIQKAARQGKISIIPALTGHGVGRELHEDPVIYNYGERGEGERLVEGMVLAIEPITCLGSGKIIQAGDESYVTADQSLAAHFEHTILITKKGNEILTK